MMYGYGPQIAAGTPHGPTSATTPVHVATAPQIAEEVNPPCGCCFDEEVDQLRALVASGVEQWEASRIVWPADEAGEAVA